MALTTLTVDQVPARRPGPRPGTEGCTVVPADGLDAARARVRSYLSAGGDA
ncbi:hypothetical protein ACGFNF_22045 [Micromonospora sp. NPDC048868]|uniref:hypothetical protein n=1 Tax=Micromonospora sp. NPDC048868 TaxID=3364258 RepID=UPI003714E690